MTCGTACVLVYGDELALLLLLLSVAMPLKLLLKLLLKLRKLLLKLLHWHPRAPLAPRSQGGPWRLLVCCHLARHW